jgi:hypothetical protein
VSARVKGFAGPIHVIDRADEARGSTVHYAYRHTGGLLRVSCHIDERAGARSPLVATRQDLVTCKRCVARFGPAT